MNNRTILVSFLISLFFYWLNNREKTSDKLALPGGSLFVDKTARDGIASLDARIKALENSKTLNDFA